MEGVRVGGGVWTANLTIRTCIYHLAGWTCGYTTKLVPSRFPMAGMPSWCKHVEALAPLLQHQRQATLALHFLLLNIYPHMRTQKV